MVRLPPESVEQYSGTFENPAYGEVQISPDGPSLRLLWHRVESPLRYLGDNRFALENDSYLRKFGEARTFPELHFRSDGFDWALNGNAPAVSFVRRK